MQPERFMQERYWLYRRENGVFYIQDRVTRRQESLKTKEQAIAKNLVAARNQAAATPALNATMAKAYLSSQSPQMFSRTWDRVMEQMAEGYDGTTLQRWRKFIGSVPIGLLRNLPLLSTTAEHFFAVLRHSRAGNSTNKNLRIVHNYALNLGWLLQPVLPRGAWPKIRLRRQRGITREEHERILAAERQPDYALFFRMLWETGGSQSDIAALGRNNINPVLKLLTYQRLKLVGKDSGSATLAIGPTMEAVLATLPRQGMLFPRLHPLGQAVRASHFLKLRKRLKITGISLHSYRYAWAERACACGMPEREAMNHLGHASKAVHRAYAKGAGAVTMSLEFYERQQKEKIVQFRTESTEVVPAVANLL